MGSYHSTATALYRSTIAILIALFGVATSSFAAYAQTYTVLHTFSGADGAAPTAGLTRDAAGNFYGTTSSGGTINANCQYGCGTVFKLTHRGSGWILTTLYSFKGGTDSAGPMSRVVFGPDGSLYGTTSGGSIDSDKGTVYSLKPPATFCPAVMCPWTKTILYSFTGTDGWQPLNGDLTFDHQGNIYGTTRYGGLGRLPGDGVVFELSKINGQWTETVIHSFDLEPGETDGYQPVAGVVLDDAGNLFGTTPMGGFYDPVDNNFGAGTVYELTPNGSGWQETIVRRFMGPDGEYPGADLTPSTLNGNHVLIGTTGAGGFGSCQSFMVQGCGVVFLLGIGNPYSFLPSQPGLSPGGPHSPITEDASGRFFGTTFSLGANNRGNVYQLVYNSDGSWTYASLYDFTQSDGGFPYGRVVFDGSGNLYGTLPGDSSACDQQHQSCGVIWEVTP